MRLILSWSISNKASAAISRTVPGILRKESPISGYVTSGGGGGGSMDRSYLLSCNFFPLSRVDAKQHRTEIISAVMVMRKRMKAKINT